MRTVIEMAGALLLALGAVMLMNALYARFSSTAVSGRVLSWEREEDGETVRWRARLAYADRDGRAHEVLSVDRAFEAGAVGPATVRYKKAQPEWAELAGTAAGTWLAPIGLAATGAALLAGAALL
jgi:hypothetical protein